MKKLQCANAASSTNPSHGTYADVLLSKGSPQHNEVLHCLPVPLKDGLLTGNANKDTTNDVSSAKITEIKPSDYADGFTLVQRKKRRSVIGKKNDSALSVIKGK